MAFERLTRKDAVNADAICLEMMLILVLLNVLTGPDWMTYTTCNGSKTCNRLMYHKKYFRLPPI